MRFAELRNKKQSYIQAIEANHYQSKLHGYVCPVCSATVFLRKGKIREAHFAHEGGVTPEGCQFFHPSNTQITTQEKPLPTENIIELQNNREQLSERPTHTVRAELSLVVNRSIPTRSIARLKLALPVKGIQKGSFEIKVGKKCETINLDNNLNDIRYINVPISCDSVKVISKNLPTKHREKILNSYETINQKLASFFGPVENLDGNFGHRTDIDPRKRYWIVLPPSITEIPNKIGIENRIEVENGYSVFLIEPLKKLLLDKEVAYFLYEKTECNIRENYDYPCVIWPPGDKNCMALSPDRKIFLDFKGIRQKPIEGKISDVYLRNRELKIAEDEGNLIVDGVLEKILTHGRKKAAIKLFTSYKEKPIIQFLPFEFKFEKIGHPNTYFSDNWKIELNDAWQGRNNLLEIPVFENYKIIAITDSTKNKTKLISSTKDFYELRNSYDSIKVLLPGFGISSLKKTSRRQPTIQATKAALINALLYDDISFLINKNKKSIFTLE